ncbi:oligosaccharide flippase family protein [Aliikangiella coralliicola]|uniref:Oligosaccharide flippase family protein n=1 Tax=Aliikangiella coralliicola TaxID=2592383 RepID=A0A545U0K8_9GAMM|nr:oligosaccharide flippase family protein [Aliikangiella coralliicola]TQV83008.1 oligosaccharide flippase family protein [Aliikangiella coralliicola]
MNEIYKNIYKLSSGTAVAQAIPLLAYPFLTRIFSPEDFGTFATTILCSSLLGIFASGCYEHAILITKSKIDAANVIVLTLLRSCLILLVSFPVIWLLNNELSIWFNDPELATSLYYAPLIALGGIIYACHSEWLIKYKEYSFLARNRIFQGVFLVASKIVIGLAFVSSQALVIGELVGRFLSSIMSIMTIAKIDHKIFLKISRPRISKLKKRFSQFPRVMVFDQFVNILGGSLHVLFIGTAFGPKELGYVALLFSALYLPITIVSSSIKDVFRQQASIEYSEYGSCRRLYLSLFKVIACFGLLVFTLGFFLSPELFPLVFGEDWRIVGEYAQIMMAMYYLNFVSMSLGGTLIFAEKIKVSLYWQILSIGLSTVALYIGCYVVGDIVSCLVYLAIARSVSYLIYIFLSYYYSLDHSRL